MDTALEGSQQETPTTPMLEKASPYDERLSSCEMSQLWILHQANSSMGCILKHFVAQAEDFEIKAVLNDALNAMDSKLNIIRNIFRTVDFPIPHGYDHEDVEPDAKRLLSDSLMLSYFKNLSNSGLVQLAHALPTAARPDVMDFLNGSLVDAQDLLNKTKKLMSKKGVVVKPPYTPVPDRVNYISGSGWYDGLFGKKRSINVLEITQVFQTMETKLAHRAILLAFAQVAKDQKIKAYFSKGKELFAREINKWSAILNEEDLPLPTSMDSEVTDSTESPYSDKLMLCHIMGCITYSATLNGFAMANCNRTDLLVAFGKSMVDIELYGKEGLDLLIDKGWMEEVPLAVNREKIISLNH